eukprot:scaffold56431_cov66-Phaeocystis_antarctica.AAC.2
MATPSSAVSSSGARQRGADGWLAATPRALDTDRHGQFGRKTHSEQLGCCATHLRRYKCNVSPPKRHLRRGCSLGGSFTPPAKGHPLLQPGLGVVIAVAAVPLDEAGQVDALAREVVLSRRIVVAGREARHPDVPG